MTIRNQPLQNKVALIIGGATTQGIELAQGLAENGSDIALIYFDEDKHDRVQTITEKVTAAGQRCLTIQGPTDRASLQSYIQDLIVPVLGPVDILISYP